jgi:outer membrane lipoprotein-sorting protein
MRRKIVLVPIVLVLAVAAVLVGLLVPGSGKAQTPNARTVSATLPTLTPVQLFAKVAQALPRTKAVHAQFTWTNNLLGSSLTLPSQAPALLKDLWPSGTGEIWYEGDNARLQLAGAGQSLTIVKKGRTVWVYNSVKNKATEYTLPAHPSPGRSATAFPRVGLGFGKLNFGKLNLGQLVGLVSAVNTNVSQTTVASHAAYVLTITPKATSTTLGSVSVAFDGQSFVPLGFTVTAKNDTTPVLSLQATDFSTSVSSSEFSYTPPKGATIVHKTVTARGLTARIKRAAGGGLLGLAHRHGKGLALGEARALTLKQARARVSFPLLSLTKPIAGLAFQDAHVLANGRVAILRYGTGFGTVVLAEAQLTPAQRTQVMNRLAATSLATPATVAGISGEQISTPLVNAFVWTTNGTFHVAAGAVTQADLQTFLAGLK